jgi:hypothetical protein
MVLVARRLDGNSFSVQIADLSCFIEPPNLVAVSSCRVISLMLVFSRNRGPTKRQINCDRGKPLSLVEQTVNPPADVLTFP